LYFLLNCLKIKLVFQLYNLLIFVGNDHLVHLVEYFLLRAPQSVLESRSLQQTKQDETVVHFFLGLQLILVAVCLHEFSEVKEFGLLVEFFLDQIVVEGFLKMDG